MLLRKIIVVGAALCGVGSAFAYDGYSEVPPVRQSEMAYYAEGQVGYASQDYYSNMNWGGRGDTSGIINNNNGNVRGGPVGGVDIGYTMNNHFGVELGWMYLPEVNVAGVNALAQPLPAVYLQSWVLYLAAKYRVLLPWVNNTDWFFKFGAAYRYASVSSAADVTSTGSLPITSGSSNYTLPMFASGFDYNVSDLWAVAFQYAHFMGSSNSFPFNSTSGYVGAMGTEAADVFTLSLAYKMVI